ncbi:MAG: nucleotidyl transferase AbiEii/AbiGii toxin family protein [Desulfuromonadales bacterium]|nr:nucleotidyl transferase AbiEii/AbiGii toxin family protein [Desulfuromonadales bacterium]
MNVFDQLVNEALRSVPQFAPLRVAVEKELLHHDILREMSRAGYLQKLTFMGGTCLRACYGSPRLSEDLDFTGGIDFARQTLADLGKVLVERLEVKYGLPVEVSEPCREEGNVDTWKLRVVTRPEHNHLPSQRINIDICALPSHDRRPMMLRNHYAVDMGTSGLIVQAESREEIFADKLVAFALRPNRIKHRDLWDIVWLNQQGVAMPAELALRKVADRRLDRIEFLHRLQQRLTLLQSDPACRKDFLQEMCRFLPPAFIAETLEQPDFWSFLVTLVTDQCEQVCAPGNAQ